MLPIHVSATMRGRAKASSKAARRGLTFGKGKNKKRFFMEEVGGDDFDRTGGRWNRLNRVIDRLNGEYHEVVTDPNGHIVRECHEPLRDHTGRGSARRPAEATPSTPTSPAVADGRDSLPGERQQSS